MTMLNCRHSPRIFVAACAMTLTLLAGCNQPTLFPNPDPALRKSNKEFAADAATRFPYKANAPRVFESKARAQVVYDLNRIEVVNFTGRDWDNVEVWVNRQYVCFVPRMENGKLKEIHYPMLYNELGKTFPLNNKVEQVKTVELYCNGTMYQLTTHPDDF
jgi:hypothetical protein